MSFSAKNYGRVWFAVTAVVIAAVAVLQSLLYLNCYDASIGLYEKGFPTGALKLAYLLIAAALCLPLLLLKKRAPDSFAHQNTLTSTLPTDFFALLTGGTIAASLVIQLINLNADDPFSILLQNPSDANATAHTMLIVTLASALPAAAHFVSVFVGKKWSFSLLLALLWTCAYMFFAYFNASTLLMSPTRQLTLAALCAVAFFLVTELRLVREIPSTLMYAIAATLAALFAGASGLGGLVLTFSGKLPFSAETAYYAFQLSIALFALFRLRAMLVPTMNADAPESDASEPDNVAEEDPT